MTTITIDGRSIECSSACIITDMAGEAAVVRIETNELLSLSSPNTLLTMTAHDDAGILRRMHAILIRGDYTSTNITYEFEIQGPIQ